MENNATNSGPLTTTQLRIRALTRWATVHLRKTDLPLTRMEQLADGVRLTALVELLCGRKVGLSPYRRRASPNTRTVDVLAYFLHFLEEDGLKLETTTEEIMTEDTELLCMKVLWPLLVYYRLSGANDGPQYVINWLRARLPGLDINNLVEDWRDGKKLAALVQSFNADSCTGWETWDSSDTMTNLTTAAAAATRLGIQPYIEVADMASPAVDSICMTVYLHQFINLDRNVLDITAAEGNGFSLHAADNH